ncbi:hypothetical protein JCM11641_002639 [Rhodosporidiobolus odoratus]
MNDELDPAFLDFDMSSHGTGLGDSLGAGFGNSLDFNNEQPDSDDEQRLGSGFGNSLDAELAGPPSPSRSRHSSGNSTSTAHGTASGAGADGDAEFATPRRRNGSGASLLAQQGQAGGNRMSLAFELASASGPAGGRTRDLMRELGIEEDEDDPDDREYDDEEEEDELAQAQQEVRRRLFAGKEKEETRGDSFSAGNSPLRRPVSGILRGKSSTASFATAAGGEIDSPPDEEGISQEELDTALQEAAAALEGSMKTTGVFLSHLRQHVTAEVDLSSHSPNLPRPAAASDPSSSSLPSGSLQRYASASSPSIATSSATIDYTDRQPVVEAFASSVLKRMYDVAAQREAQTRELTEMERIFARNEGGWRAVLAGLDPLPLDEGDEASEAHTGSEPNGVLPPAEAIPSSPNLDSAPPPSSAHSHSPTSAPSSVAQAQLELTQLRTLTSSLLTALASICDLSQVQSALSSDAGRKLRALKVQVGAVKDDLGGIEKSEAFVREYEAREKGQPRGRYAEQAREEMRAAQEALEEGWRRAQSVFGVGVAV